MSVARQSPACTYTHTYSLSSLQLFHSLAVFLSVCVSLCGSVIRSPARSKRSRGVTLFAGAIAPHELALSKGSRSLSLFLARSLARRFPDEFLAASVSRSLSSQCELVFVRVHARGVHRSVIYCLFANISFLFSI